ncbi:MAG TPA: M14 family zinc carboxypeptidase [Flavisolibacter sp.]|nr:M14 family zinc carboxypeptidase [Flavisolibacter sp.]
MRILFRVLFITLPFSCFSQKFTTKFESSKGEQTPTYFEIIEWWKKLDAASGIIQMQEMGPTDAGFPLHLVLISGNNDFDIKSIKSKKKNIIFIINGIHPGEPDGIDASMLLARDIVENKLKLPGNVVLALIPVYNIGGCLNRSANYRVDQNGPEEFGFRGNSQNLDLNRDFIKNDSKEATSFAKIFHYLDPDVFVDNHVSNGADYQHVMTLLTSQHNKLGGEMGAFLNKKFEPALYSLMKTKGFDLVPYVNHFSDTPDKGWTEFWDSPRYSSGYTSLWNSFSFVPETHMLKPYAQRVASTKALMESFIEFTSDHNKEIIELRSKAKKQVLSQNSFPLAWKLDKSKFTEINYKGFEATRKPSEVSGLPRLFYDRTKPYETKVPFFNHYTDTLSVQKPLAYIIPQGWWKVIERLQANNIQMRQLVRDTVMEVEAYKIESYQPGSRPFEGHHLNTSVKVSKQVKTVSFRKGDYFIPLNQAGNRFLIETLEPQAEDSYFAWNFFDPILGQKEGYSDYHFEDIASDFLKNNPEVREKLEQRKSTDSSFAKSGRAQLSFVFQNSPYFETAYLQYPVYRLTAKH